MLTLLQSLFGLVAFIAFTWAISENRRRFPWRTAGAALLLQVLMAAALLKIPVFRQFFLHLN
ncbi:MAG TPA: Na+ dependent nucleoside transporter N-terminal domain-containing protein, partial [Candidatus Competibacteraceae bacterium]|nr:Na+ dependent nucleoside transporter N-terminal domain-containing protein [Candidatus Competibacteraceae bacterium]